MYECRHCVTAVARAILDRAPASALPRNRQAWLACRSAVPGAQSFSSSTRRRLNDDDILPFDAATKKLEIPSVPRRHLELELKWLPDKVKFAERVRKLLHDDNDPDKALALVQLRSKPDEPTFTTVAWNHILKFHLDAGRYTRAFNLFNDMKKRGQHPDTVTFLFLIRGMAFVADSTKRPQAAQMEKVVHILQSMFASNSKVKPTVQHVDAALQAVATDLDMIWKVVDLMPEEGPAAAQNTTYTIILTALRESMFAQDKAVSDEDLINAAKVRAAERAIDLWSVIIGSWKAGGIIVDTELVDTMAGILVKSPSLAHRDAILDLVQQTAQIPRLLERLGETSRHTAHIPQVQGQFGTSVAIQDSPFASEIDFISPTQGKKKRGPRPIEPGSRLLALVLRACHVLRAPQAASKYWDHFLQDRNIKPELDAVHQMLLICSSNRRSASAGDMFDVLVKYNLRPTYAIYAAAIKACQRNVKAHNSITHAGKIVQYMANHAAIPEPEVLCGYISLALTTKDGSKIANAIDNIDPCVRSLRSLLEYGGYPSSWSDDRREAYQVAAIQLFQYMVGSIDQIISHGWVVESESRLWAKRRAELTKLVSASRKLVNPSKFQKATAAATVPELSRQIHRRWEEDVISDGDYGLRDKTDRPRLANIDSALSDLPSDFVRELHAR